ncbi:hypothetical protein EV421DRAFT_1997214 [Armillaria borealis]|uniref:F-box domain-containing protein n=1 Tax=Armillaria borealis TaxID=47425 RepID=A0AA39M4K7_9AGAR|nr:hypothetical protein EV421DRAFT_1997214 [Armillaria borealis]
MVSDAKENVPPTGSSGKNGRQVKKRLKGALAAFVDMPLDIMLCIFELLDPLDLLHLARLSKAFQRVLMSKSSILAWKSARRNIIGLPEPLHGLSEPAWANLVFVPICHFCYKASAKSPELLFRARICTACMPLHTLSIADLQRVPECIRTNGGTLLVATLIPISPLKRAGKRPPEESCLVRDYKEICQAWRACNTEHERNTLIQSRSGSMAHLRSHASECSSWLSRMQIVKEMETEKLKRNRLQAIQQKLACLGYGAELAAMPSVDILAKHSLVNQTRPLTDRRELVKYMEKVKVDRLAREHHELLQRRRKVAIDYLRMCKALAPTTLFPPMLNFFELPPIRKIIHLPSNETVTPGHFHRITELIVLHSEAWESSITQRVVDFTLGEDSLLSLEEKCSQAKLARNVFPEPAMSEEQAVVHRTALLSRHHVTSLP